MVDWLTWLIGFVMAQDELPGERLLAVFDGLYELFVQPGLAAGPLLNPIALFGGGTPPVGASRAERDQLHHFVVALAVQADIPNPHELADAWTLLVDGALVAAQRLQSPDPVPLARSAARELLWAHVRSSATLGFTPPRHLPGMSGGMSASN